MSDRATTPCYHVWIPTGDGSASCLLCPAVRPHPDRCAHTWELVTDDVFSCPTCGSETTHPERAQ
jgi:hypothetical protein